MLVLAMLWIVALWCKAIVRSYYHSYYGPAVDSKRFDGRVRGVSSSDGVGPHL